MSDVTGKVAIVTGGASGIGAATALRLGRAGAKVVVTDINDEAGADVAGSIGNGGGEAIFLHLDVSDEDQWRAAVAKTIETYGRLDILFSNAGFAVVGPVTELTLEDWRRQMAVNLDGVFLSVKHCIPAMLKSGGGSIILNSSLAGLIGAPAGSAYSASKGGVRLFAKSMALEYAAENIRVNSIHPGVIDTPIWQQAADRAENGIGSTSMDDLGKTVPMGRVGQADEVANAVLFLASDEASYITGSEIVIDGGLFAQ